MSFADSPILPSVPDLAGETVQRRLLQSERDLRSILDNMPAMIGYWDRDLRNRFGNHAYFDWFGIDPASMQGMHIREVIGEERYRLNRPYMDAVLRGEAQVFERAIPVPGGGGQVRHSLAHYIPDVLDGEVVGFYVLVSDITKIKEIEAAYQASEARYRAVLMDQTELISRFSRDGRFVFVNEVYCRFFGKREVDLLGRSWQPVALAEDVPSIEARLAEMSAENPVVTIENRVYSGSGELRWMQFVNRGFYAQDGRLLEVQSIGRDITDRKQAEQALRRAHDELELRVVERTEQLRSLATEATLAEERERQSIARDLHDDLGQLLHVAKIKLDMLARSLPAASPLVGELDALLADASRQVRSLTAQLAPPALRDLGLPAALRWLGDEMARQYGLQVVCEIDESVRGDLLSPAQATILFRAVRELLINVQKHAGTLQARVALRFEASVLLLVVADAGVGLANSQAAWHRNDAFGLFSIRERVLSLGGRTEIETAAGCGMKVTIRMPISIPGALPAGVCP